MSDSIVSFPLRNASQDDLGIALARCYADYSSWHSQAAIILGYNQFAESAGIRSVIRDRTEQWVSIFESKGILNMENAKSQSRQELIDKSTSHQFATADQGLKIASLVILHNACERFYWRLIRFGLVANRKKVLSWIENRKIIVKDVVEQDRDVLLDNQIENWWNQLEREPLLDKWDFLIRLVCYPEELKYEDKWNFNRDMLFQFDEARHNAVHHDGDAVRSFDLDEFTNQLSRSQGIWLMHIAERLGIKVPADIMFNVNFTQQENSS